MFLIIMNNFGIYYDLNLIKVNYLCFYTAYESLTTKVIVTPLISCCFSTKSTKLSFVLYQEYGFFISQYAKCT